MVLETTDHRILIDPMLGDQGCMPSFTWFRFKTQRNPIVALPVSAGDMLRDITHCLITHKHPDHIDKAGIQFLTDHQIPVTCSWLDASFFTEKGLHVVQTLKYWEPENFFGGKITGIPARHGYGYIARSMGNVMGFYLQLPGEPSVYLSSDTIYTAHVDKVLKELRPDLSVVACGSAQMDLFKPILMTPDDIVRFVSNAPGRVLANHLEAVNHCPTTRETLKRLLEDKGLLGKVFIPEDGEVIPVN